MKRQRKISYRFLNISKLIEHTRAPAMLACLGCSILVTPAGAAEESQETTGVGPASEIGMTNKAASTVKDEKVTRQNIPSERSSPSKQSAPPAKKPAPLPVPLNTTVFDSPIVQRLLDNIEAPGQVGLLKSAYFSRPSGQALPLSEGYQMLEEALLKEPVGSRRWFLLQGTQAWVTLSLPNVQSEERLHGYRMLFEQSSAARVPQVTAAFSQCVNDFLQAVILPFGEAGSAQVDLPQVRALMKQAWAAYSASLRGAGRWPGSESQWSQTWIQAVEASAMHDELAPEVENLIADPRLHRTYNVTMLATTLLKPSRPARALELLKQSKELMPKDKEGKEEPGEVIRYSQLMVELLLALDTSHKVRRDEKPDLRKLKEAIPYQQQYILVTGKGWARLVHLQCRAGDEAGLRQTLKYLKAPEIAASEINETAELLIELWDETRKVPRLNVKKGQQGGRESSKAPVRVSVPDRPQQSAPGMVANREVKYPQAGLQAAVLLSSYLNYCNSLNYLGRGQTRDLEQELRARGQLGALYLATNKLAEARSTLDTKHMQFDAKQANAQTRFYYEEIIKLRESWQKQLIASQF